MQAIRQGLGVWIVFFIKLHRVPSVFPPILPVLHYHADGQFLLAKTVGCLKDFLRAMETLTTVDIAQSPFRHRGTLTCQLAVCSDDFIGRTNENGIVHSIGYWRMESGLVLYLIII